jgi:AcrR family transcriptional regulator
MKMNPATRPYRQSSRAESAEATGRRISDAFLARLLRQWYDEITLDRVAEDAGVTVQTVVRRFRGKEGVLAAAIKTFGSQINARRAAPGGDVDRAVDNLLVDYEQTGDAVIRLLALEPRHPVLKEFLDFGRGEHRRWVETAFVKLLGELDAATRRRALDALVIATDVYTWKLLRRDMARSVAATATTIKCMIHATLAEFSTHLSSGAKACQAD